MLLLLLACAEEDPSLLERPVSGSLSGADPVWRIGLEVAQPQPLADLILETRADIDSFGPSGSLKFELEDADGAVFDSVGDFPFPSGEPEDPERTRGSLELDLPARAFRSESFEGALRVSIEEPEQDTGALKPVLELELVLLLTGPDGAVGMRVSP